MPVNEAINHSSPRQAIRVNLRDLSYFLIKYVSWKNGLL